ncbi:MAG: tetratricopeptide repeat protein [Methylophilaceae bacterium]|nr:tetratricopeptide repeat protein [Methylophilaceae bacterium]
MKAFIVLLLCLLLPVTANAVDPVDEIDKLAKKGQRLQALEKIDAFLGSQPKDAWGRNITQMRFRKGMLLAELKRMDEAIQVFTKLIQDYPDLPEPYNNLAVLYAEQGRLEEARETLERALRTDTAYALAHRNLGEIYARLAAQAYDQVLQTSKGGRPTAVLIKELCDNYGRVAKQSVGRQHVEGDRLSMLSDIPKSRTSASGRPRRIEIDEMAIEVTEAPRLPPAFIDPGRQDESATSAIEPSSKPTMQQEPRSETVQQEQAILAAVRAWAAAWSRQDVSTYLAHYAKGFRTPNGQSRGEWEKLRRERLQKPRRIRVTVESPRVTLRDEVHATVTFRQRYHSDGLQTTTRKTLLMIKSGGKWLIEEERLGG